MDLKSLSDQFIEFEKTHDALQWQIEGINAWRLIRFDIFQALVSERNLFEFAHPQLKSRKNNIKKHFENIKTSVLKNNFRKLKKNNFLFLPHNRNINGKDIYSHELMSYIGFENLNNIYPATPPTPYSNAIILGWPALKIAMNNIAMNRFKYIPYKKHHNDIQNFSNKFRTFFKSQIKIEKIIFRELYRFQTYEAAYTKILKCLTPKAVILVTHYSHLAMINAAQKLQIPTYEIQHGTISTNHMGYYFPHDDNPPYMPDTLLCHGEHWTRKPPLPLSLNTQIIGATHVSKLINIKSNKIENQVLIFSQGTVATDLFAFAIESANLAKNHKIIYRLHPSELRNAYPTSGFPSNFEIRTDASTFFDDLTQSEFIATVYSTTIYEAMACGAKGIVIGLNGHNAVQDIIDNGDAQLANTPEDFIKALKKSKPCKHPEKYYAAVNYDALNFTKLE